METGTIRDFAEELHTLLDNTFPHDMATRIAHVHAMATVLQVRLLVGQVDALQSIDATLVHLHAASLQR